MTWEFFAAGAFAALFAGVSKGGFGSGAAFAGAAILAIVAPPGVALGIMLPLLMVIDVATLRPYWRQWGNEETWVLVLGGLPGVALGVLFYRIADADLMRVLIGAIAVGFVVWQLAVRAGLVRGASKPLPVGAGLMAGVVAGFTSFVSHAGGPPAAVYLLSRGLSKTGFQATTVSVFFAINISKAVPYGFLGLFTRETLTIALMLAPFALIGAWIGVCTHRIVPERVFFAITYVLLTVTGLKLIADGL
ncbi:sulfite exporter TauE/SafE family protein [Roseovarius autotrophicus]|uniref:sulfite exporter TauE/SafE family protein n=1 Tax=Roseovarius autotrophicus TaxID=2824121 RepID=UPI001B35BDF9|nr:sulfite exporter TauE/SafE family protein [Roseovarius autotrophicus]